MIENTRAETAPVNAESQRVAALLAPGFGGAPFGFLLKEVGGPVISAQNADFRYEPASAMKALYLLDAMKRVQAGTEKLDKAKAFSYWVDPADPTNSAVCPDPAWEVPANQVKTTVRDGLERMMQVSDNRATRGFALRYGVADVNALAASLGMTGTHIGQDRVGCGFENGVRNDLTLSDFDKLYGAVATGAALNPANTNTFWSTMINFGAFSPSPIADVVAQEAAALGKSQTVVDQFLAALHLWEKGGDYQFCTDAFTCDHYSLDIDNLGRVSVPFKSAGGTVVPKDYFWSVFANDVQVPCAPGSGCPLDSAAANAIYLFEGGASELLRPVVRDALANW
jgi:hypothetical protein